MSTVAAMTWNGMGGVATAGRTNNAPGRAIKASQLLDLLSSNSAVPQYTAPQRATPRHGDQQWEHQQRAEQQPHAQGQTTARPATGGQPSGHGGVMPEHGTLAARARERVLEQDWSPVVRRCLDGDSLAWTELVKAHHRRVYGLCYRFTGSPHDSEDLTQDVFLKIYGNLASFDLTKGSFQVWVSTLTRNLLVDHFRRSRQQRVTDSMDAGWDDPEELKPSERLADPRPNPLEHAASRELERMVQEALTKLSPELREAVILRDLQDFDYKEIALVLHIPEGTVKSRISRGRAELARLLERNKKQVV